MIEPDNLTLYIKKNPFDYFMSIGYKFQKDDKEYGTYIMVPKDSDLDFIVAGLKELIISANITCKDLMENKTPYNLWAEKDYIMPDDDD